MVDMETPHRITDSCIHGLLRDSMATEWFSFAEIFTSDLSRGEYPEGLSKTEKSSLRKRAKYFAIQDTQLYYYT